MFRKFQRLALFLLTFLTVPYSILAYSSKIIVSGDTVGIKLNTEGILIVGSYDINGHNTLVEAGLKNGDIINKINNKNVNKVEDMVNIIKECNCDNIDISYLRDKEQKKTNLNLYESGNIKKTGLYVKDSISGIGTLTYIDPETKLFGVLGHEIIDNATGQIINIDSGTIFDSKVTGITKSERGIPGEKNAIIYNEKIEGNIFENTNKGLFGKYTSSINTSNLYKVASIRDVKIGDAKILTVLDGTEVGQFSINILKVSETSDKLKNIEFEVTDKELLNKTNGIVQGMSGSPIIQGDYVVGAVTHVVVENPHKGYGILITNMLEEGEN